MGLGANLGRRVLALTRMMLFSSSSFDDCLSCETERRESKDMLCREEDMIFRREKGYFNTLVSVSMSVVNVGRSSLLCLDDE